MLREKKMKQIKILSENTKQFFEDYIQILDEMEVAMQEINPTDSISKTYILQMLPYNEAGQKLSKNILQYTTNPEIESVAKSIIASNQNALDNLLLSCKNSKNFDKDNGLYLKKYKIIFDIMTKKMRNIQSSNNINKAYLLSILAHHEGGISFAKNLLMFDVCFELKEFAKKYIIEKTLQTQTIKKMLRK